MPRPPAELSLPAADEHGFAREVGWLAFVALGFGVYHAIAYRSALGVGIAAVGGLVLAAAVAVYLRTR